MYVCLCHGVSDDEIRQLIAQGKRCSTCVGHACGAGTCCGACVDMIEDMIDRHAPTRCGPRQNTTSATADTASAGPSF